MTTYALTLTSSGEALIDTDDINNVIAVINGTTGIACTPDDITDYGEYGIVTDDQDSVTVRIYE